jgi:Tfp pilus assembly protein PilO
MRNLSQTQRRFIITLAAMVAVDVALLAYLLWPGSSPSALENQLNALQSQSRALAREVGPLEDMGGKLAKTRTNIKSLYQENIPHRSSQISQQVEKLTKQAGVKTQAIRYTIVRQEKSDLADVQRIGVETTVTGDYAQVAKFINALEQSDLIFIIDQVSLSGQESGTVSLQIKFETFLREAA